MKNKHKAIFCMVFSAFSFALMNTFIRLSGDLPSIQKSFFRNFVAVIFAFVILKKEKTPLKCKPENLKFLLIRSIAGTLGILGNFYAVDHLVLSDASILNKMSPFFAILFSYLFLKEKLKPYQIIAVIVAFLGSLLIIKPSFLNVSFIPALAGFLGGLGAGIAYTAVRYLGQHGEKGAFIVFFFSAFSCVVTLPYLIFAYHPMTIKQFVFLLLAGLSATGGQFGITNAYCYAPAKEVSIYDYSQIIFSALLGFILFSQIPDKWSILGYITIISSAIFMFIRNNKEA